jgi:hypothetical protein
MSQAYSDLGAGAFVTWYDHQVPDLQVAVALVCAA